MSFLGGGSGALADPTIEQLTNQSPQLESGKVVNYVLDQRALEMLQSIDSRLRACAVLLFSLCVQCGANVDKGIVDSLKE